jgi:hypothetical protein
LRGDDDEQCCMSAWWWSVCWFISVWLYIIQDGSLGCDASMYDRKVRNICIYTWLGFIGDWVVSWRGGKKRSGQTHLMNWERSVIDRSDWLRIAMVGDRTGCDVSIRCLNVAECYWVLFLTWRGEWSARI